MNVASNQSGAPAGRTTLGRLRTAPVVWSLIAAVVMGTLAVFMGHRLASAAMVDLGPTDYSYVEGFRELEKDGPVHFRWTAVPASEMRVPIRFCGPGSLRLRVRRHFVDPALLSVSMSGTVLGQRGVQARQDHPYEVLEFPVTKAFCGSDVSILLESEVQNDRPLGVAVDWVEFRSQAGFSATPASLSRGAAVLIVLAGGLALVGAGWPLIVGLSGTTSLLLGSVLALDPVAGERILRGALPALFLSLAVGLLMSRLTAVRELSVSQRVTLFVIVFATLISRLAFLHPQAFYPDYRVHALVQETLDRQGLSGFLDQLFELQYARSLGLQQIDGLWYPFPYPPGAYVLVGTVRAVFSLSPLDASIVTAALAASLIPLLTLAVALRLGLGPAVGLAGAFYVALQPLLVRRMALGFFPGVIGQCMDALGILLLLHALRDYAGRTQRTALFGAALVLAFLVYTQSIANFGLLVAGLMAVEVLRRSSPKVVIGVAVAAALALAGSVGIFYWRYAPVMENVANHRPQPESVVLDRLDQIRRSALSESRAEVEEDVNDPFAGSTVNPARGVARLGSRLWRFNGPFALAMVAGLVLLWRQCDRLRGNLVSAWAGVALWISLLAAGLPSPNGFQHLKDLEFTAPLFALGLGVLTQRLWSFRPTLAAAFAGLWTLYALRALAIEFSDRLIAIAGR